MYINREDSAGTIFHSLRKQRHLTVKTLAKDIVSVSAINKFEAGTTQLSFLKLAALLKRMDVNLDEYYRQATPKTVQSTYDAFLERIEPIYQNNDLLTLKNIAEKELEPTSNKDVDLIEKMTLFALIKGIDENYPIPKKLLEKLNERFMAIEYWNSFELSILSNCSVILTSQMIKTLSKELIYSNTQDPSENCLIALTNMADVLYRRSDYASTQELLSYLEKISLNQNQFIIRFKITFTKNLLNPNKRAGKKNNLQLIQSLRLIGANGLASSYEEYMDKYPSPQNLSHIPKKRKN